MASPKGGLARGCKALGKRAVQRLEMQLRLGVRHRREQANTQPLRPGTWLEEKAEKHL